MQKNKMKDIPGYEGRYAATTSGQIYSYPKSWSSGRGVVRKHDGGFMKLTVCPEGYNKVILRKSGKCRCHRVNRLIAMTYLGDIQDCVVNHKDGDRLNDAKNNLEICTASWNVRHGLREKYYQKAMYYFKQLPENYKDRFREAVDT